MNQPFARGPPLLWLLRLLDTFQGLQKMTGRSGVQAEPATLAGLVGVLSLNGQQPLATALQQKALDLQHAAPPMPSHFRPCWAERGAAVGLSMKPHIGQVAVEVPTEKLSRCA